MIAMNIGRRLCAKAVLSAVDCAGGRRGNGDRRSCKGLQQKRVSRKDSNRGALCKQAFAESIHAGMMNRPRLLGNNAVLFCCWMAASFPLLCRFGNRAFRLLTSDENLRQKEWGMAQAKWPWPGFQITPPLIMPNK